MSATAPGSLAHVDQLFREFESRQRVAFEEREREKKKEKAAADDLQKDAKDNIEHQQISWTLPPQQLSKAVQGPPFEANAPHRPDMSLEGESWTKNFFMKLQRLELRTGLRGKLHFCFKGVKAMSVSRDYTWLLWLTRQSKPVAGLQLDMMTHAHELQVDKDALDNYCRHYFKTCGPTISDVKARHLLHQWLKDSPQHHQAELEWRAPQAEEADVFSLVPGDLKQVRVQNSNHEALDMEVRRCWKEKDQDKEKEKPRFFTRLPFEPVFHKWEAGDNLPAVIMWDAQDCATQ